MAFMTDSADHISGKTGLTLTITASKAGGAFASISPTVTERGDGWYALALTSSHTDTLGDLAIRATGTGADPTDLVCQVQTIAGEVAAIKAKTDALPADPAGVADLPSEPDNAGIAAIKAKTDSLTFTVAGAVDANALRMNDAEIIGTGTTGDAWRGVGVAP